MRYLIICIMLSISQLSYAKEATSKESTKKGWRESYGGDSDISDFKSIGYSVFSHLSNSFFYENFKIPQNDFLNTIQKSIVICEENLTLEGQKKDAINYPFKAPQLIKLNCEKFSKLSYNLKVRLVIHEYLPLNFIEDIDYFKSQLIESEYFKSLNVSSFEEGRVFNAITSCDLSLFEQTRKDFVINLLKRFGGPVGSDSLELLVGAGCVSVLRLLKDEGELQKEMYRDSLKLALMEYFYDHFLSDYRYVSNRPYNEIYEETKMIEFESLVSILDFNNDKSFIRNYIIPKLDINNFHHVKYDYGFDKKYRDLNFCKEGATLLHVVAHYHNHTPGFQSHFKKLYRWVESMGALAITKNSCGETATLEK